MNDSDRRRYEMQIRVVQFGTDNAGDFSGIATTKFGELGTLVGETEGKSASQQSGFGEAAQQFEVKDTCREDLRDIMSDISRTSKSMEYAFDSISDKFRFQRNMGDADMLAKARAFHSESATYEADFISYGMDPDFRKDLNDAANAFEASFSNTAYATAEHVAATADTSAKIREGMIKVRILDGIVRNVYANDPGKLAVWISASHIEEGAKGTDTDTVTDVTQADYSNYLLPASEILAPPEPPGVSVEQTLLAEAVKIVEVLASFDLHGRVINIATGPVFTVFEFEPDPGTTTARIAKRTNDLSLAFFGRNVAVRNPSGKPLIPIEVLNENPRAVRLRELLESARFVESSSLLTYACGRTLDGASYVIDLAALPHLLMGGATGAGKSTCLHSIILSVLYKARPDEVKLILIDPRRVELGVYSDIPHLATPVITEHNRAAISLEWAVNEAQRRLRDLSGLGVPNIDEHNREVRRRNPLDQWDDDGKPLRVLPYLLIIIDEIGELLADNSRIGDALSTLASTGRAAGIHLIITTGRPSTEVITSEIKANFPARIALSTVSRSDSRTILDAEGAENLRGSGDALFLAPKTKEIVRVHPAYATFDEVKRVVDFVEKQGRPEYQGLEENDAGPGLKDPLFSDALKCVINAKRASTSLLQRHLRIGYGRAAAILDAIVREGLVGEMDSTTRSRPLLAKAYEEITEIEELNTLTQPPLPAPAISAEVSAQNRKGANLAKTFSVVFLIITIILLVVSCGSCSEYTSLYKERISGTSYVTPDQMGRLAITVFLTLIGAGVTAFLSLLCYVVSQMDSFPALSTGAVTKGTGRRGRTPNLFGRRRKSSIIKAIKRDIRKYGD